MLENADVLVVTDGLARASPDMVDTVNRAKEKHGVRVWSVVLGQNDPYGVRPFSDEIWRFDPHEAAKASGLLDRFGTDYQRVRHDRRTGGVDAFFPRGFARHSITNRQLLDERALRGRLLSSSYTPSADDPARDRMVSELGALFERHQDGGTVTITYDTELFLGRL